MFYGGLDAPGFLIPDDDQDASSTHFSSSPAPRYAKYNRQETIKRHREMWSWIADKISEVLKLINENPNADAAEMAYRIDMPTSLSKLKMDAIKSVHPEDSFELMADCYLCTYDQNERCAVSTDIFASHRHHKKCDYCPLGYQKSNGAVDCLCGLYAQFSMAYHAGFSGENKEMAVYSRFVYLAKEVAMEIAHLPEIPEVGKEIDQNG